MASRATNHIDLAKSRRRHQSGNGCSLKPSEGRLPQVNILPSVCLRSAARRPYVKKRRTRLIIRSSAGLVSGSFSRNEMNFRSFESDNPCGVCTPHWPQTASFLYLHSLILLYFERLHFICRKVSPEKPMVYERNDLHFVWPSGIFDPLM